MPFYRMRSASGDGQYFSVGMMNGIVREHELDGDEVARAWREGDIGSLSVMIGPYLPGMVLELAEELGVNEHENARRADMRNAGGRWDS